MSESASKRYPPELKERAVRMVAEIRDQHDSQWAAMNQVSQLLGVGTDQGGPADGYCSHPAPDALRGACLLRACPGASYAAWAASKTVRWMSSGRTANAWSSRYSTGEASLLEPRAIRSAQPLGS